MTTRQRIKTIWIVSAAVNGIAVLALAAGLLTDVSVDATESVPYVRPGQAARTTTDTNSDKGLPELAQLQRAASFDLRRPLIDPAKPQTAARTPARRTMSASLIGTVHEPGHSMAMFQTSDGIKFASEGETIPDRSGPVTVTTIGTKAVTVRFANQTRSLPLPLPPDAK